MIQARQDFERQGGPISHRDQRLIAQMELRGAECRRHVAAWQAVFMRVAV